MFWVVTHEQNLALVRPRLVEVHADPRGERRPLLRELILGVLVGVLVGVLTRRSVVLVLPVQVRTRTDFSV